MYCMVEQNLLTRILIMTQSQISYAYALHMRKMQGNGLTPLSYHRFLKIINQLGY